MAARAAMRAGAGYVTACVPALAATVSSSSALPEVMTVPLPDDDGALAPQRRRAVLRARRARRRARARPGPRPRATARSRSRASWRRGSRSPLLLDADGLNAHAGRLERARGRERADRADAARRRARRACSSSTAREIERERLRHARAAAERARAVVVLKGDDTLVAAPDGRVAVSRGGSPALATAGTGDVLSGVIARAARAGARRRSTAACAGVWLHADAGRDRGAPAGAVEGVIAGDVIEALPRARRGERPAHDAPTARAARARVNLAAIERNCARLRSRAARRRASCARSSRPTATATAPRRARAPRWPAARPGWRSPARSEARELRDGGHAMRRCS